MFLSFLFKFKVVFRVLRELCLSDIVEYSDLVSRNLNVLRKIDKIQRTKGKMTLKMLKTSKNQYYSDQLKVQRVNTVCRSSSL